MGRMASAVEARSSLATPEKWVVEWFKGGTQTPSGVHVTEDTALHYGPFFAGVRIISEDLGSLPFPLYERLDPRGKRRAREHPLYPLLHDAANPLMSSQAFRETLTGHAVMWGGGFAEVVTRRGVVTELWPLRPDRMTPKFNPRTRRLVYRYEDSVNGIYRTYLPDEILHVHGLGFDGIKGYSVLELARNSIGAGIAAETYGATFFKNSARASGVLQHPGVLSDAARNNMRESWEKLHKGSDNAHRIAILEEGVTWQQIGIPPEDAQFLETRRFDVLDQARWLRLPPHMLAELGRATWNNIESEKIDYVTKSLRTWLTRWESAVWMRLLDDVEQQRYFAEHVVEGLLRGDMKSRFEAYRIGREIGLYSADDLAEMENRNPLPDGKGQVYFVPLNWVPAPSPDDDPARSLPAGIAARSMQGRRRIAEAFRPLLADVEERMARFERTHVARLVRQHFGDRTRNSVSEFAAAVDELYEGEVLPLTVERWLPVMTALAEDIIREAADEAAYQGDVDLTDWIAAVVTAHAEFRIGSAKRQVISLAENAADADKAAEAITARLDEWVEVRPDRVALWESIAMANAAAREVWRKAGRREMRWVAVGDDCPYCNRLDGKTVGVEQPFVPAGGEVEGADGDDPLPVERNTFHPPAHPGCDCMISVV